MIIVAKNGVTKELQVSGMNVPVAVAAPIAFLSHGMWAQAVISLVILAPLMWLMSAVFAGLLTGLGITYGTEANVSGVMLSLLFPIVLSFKSNAMVCRHYISNGWTIESGTCPKSWNIKTA